MKNHTKAPATTARALPREERDLFISAGNRHLMAFDNLSHLSDSFADCFCRLATGGGYSARALDMEAAQADHAGTSPRPGGRTRGKAS